MSDKPNLAGAIIAHRLLHKLIDLENMFLRLVKIKDKIIIEQCSPREVTSIHDIYNFGENSVADCIMLIQANIIYFYEEIK